MGGRTGGDWFTKFSLSRALHTHPDEVQKWINLGWLKSRTLTTAGVKAPILYADDFCEFVKQHGRHVVGRRLTYDALWFVQNYGVSAEPCRTAVGQGDVQQARSNERKRMQHPAPTDLQG